MYLSAKRIVRSFGIFFGLLSAILLTAFFVVRSLADVAHELVEKALARYSNFTGKIALQNFAEDKTLYIQVKDLQETVLPFLDFLLPVILVLAILLAVLCVFCVVLPLHCAKFFVKLKIWKELPFNCYPQEILTEKNMEIPWKKVGIISGIIVFLILFCLLVRACNAPKVDLVKKDLSEVSLLYINTVKENFSKTKKIVTPKSFPESEYFNFANEKGRFVAVLKVPVDGCKASSTWKIVPEVKGLFEKKLNLYRTNPKDSACINILPNFKNVGK